MHSRWRTWLFFSLFFLYTHQHIHEILLLYSFKGLTLKNVSKLAVAAAGLIDYPRNSVWKLNFKLWGRLRPCMHSHVYKILIFSRFIIPTHMERWMNHKISWKCQEFYDPHQVGCLPLSRSDRMSVFLMSFLMLYLLFFSIRYFFTRAFSFKRSSSWFSHSSKHAIMGCYTAPVAACLSEIEKDDALCLIKHSNGLISFRPELLTETKPI